MRTELGYLRCMLGLSFQTSGEIPKRRNGWKQTLCYFKVKNYFNSRIEYLGLDFKKRFLNSKNGSQKSNISLSLAKIVEGLLK